MDDHPLVFGKIHVIEWLWSINPKTGDPDRCTGKEVHSAIAEMLAANPGVPVQLAFYQVSSRSSFLAYLKSIEEECRITGKTPLLHIDSHGDEDGIGLTQDDGLSWVEFMKAPACR